MKTIFTIIDKIYAIIRRDKKWLEHIKKVNKELKDK